MKIVKRYLLDYRMFFSSVVCPLLISFHSYASFNRKILQSGPVYLSHARTGGPPRVLNGGRRPPVCSFVGISVQVSFPRTPRRVTSTGGELATFRLRSNLLTLLTRRSYQLSYRRRYLGSMIFPSTQKSQIEKDCRGSIPNMANHIENFLKI